VAHGCVVIAVSLTIFAKHTSNSAEQLCGTVLQSNHSVCDDRADGGWGTGGSWIHAVVDAASAQPVEAACAVGEFFIFIATMGNSPIAWVVAIFFNSVTADQWASMLAGAEATFGNMTLVVGFLGLGIFSFAYVVHGLLLLPLDLYATPKALDTFMVTKVQGDKRLDPSKMINAALVMVANLLLVGFPYLLGLGWLSTNTNYALRIQSDLPTHRERLCHFVCTILMNEVFFFYSHWAMHSSLLYKRFHKQHHEFTSPVALVAIYCHPLEFLVCDLFPLSAAFYPCRCHAFFAVQWAFGAVIGTQVHHSGFRMPWTVSYDDQPDYHDFHHQKFKCNYGLLGILDHLHGTNAMYLEHLAKEKAA